MAAWLERGIRITAVAILFVILWSRVEIGPPPPPPPPKCEKIAMLRILGTPIELTPKEIEECPPPPQPPEVDGAKTSSKAEIAPLRHRGLFTEFYADPETIDLQRRFVAAELYVDHQQRLDAFAQIVERSPSKEIEWRATLGMALTHLRYGNSAGAADSAERAQDIAADLPQLFRADPAYVLGMVATDPELQLEYFLQARDSDPYFFEANVQVLALVAIQLRSAADPADRLRLLDHGLQSIRNLSTLEDKALLVELQFENASFGGHHSAEKAILDAAISWYLGRVDQSRASLASARALCQVEEPVCQRVGIFLEIIDYTDDGTS